MDKIMKLECYKANAFCEYIVYANDINSRNKKKELLLTSLFNRSNVELKALTASISSGCVFKICEYDYQFARIENHIQSFSAVVNMGYEKFSHAIVVNEKINKDYIITSYSNLQLTKKVFYDFIMTNFDFPIMLNWVDVLFEKAIREKKLIDVGGYITSDKSSNTICINNSEIDLNDMLIYRTLITANWLEKTISACLKDKTIYISKQVQMPLNITTMDSYFENYGHTIISNLEKNLKPLVDVNGKVENIALLNKKLYPQQGAIVNGLVALLKTSNYAILNEGMGCGKSLQGISTVEAYFVMKYLKQHPKETLKDVYLDPSKINYRVIIMPPGHLVEKWVKECEDEIPYAKVSIIDELEQLVTIKKNGSKRNGREIFVIGKDFAKLSYSSIPVPSIVKQQGTPYVSCRYCGKKGTFESKHNKIPCVCGTTDWIIKRGKDVRGLICPECDEILLMGIDDNPLLPHHFNEKRKYNLNCICCGSNLWQPHVKNIGVTKPKEKKWFKICHPTNKTKKNTRTSWILEGHEATTYELLDIDYKDVEISVERLTRKVSPANFIKKQLKAFFDVAIFDEAHVFKGGATAQGIAMHAILKASKKQLALTGTIAGGFASHLFYLLYRLDPHRMLSRGFKYSDEMAFTEMYGTKEAVYEYTGNGIGRYNSNSRGKQIQAAQAKPGISPLIFSHFLMDKAVFLDLTDMGQYLPPLKEYVMTVPLNKEIEQEYRHVIQRIKSYSDFPGINGLSASMLQFSLAYADKPYGYGPIKDPKTGSVVVEPNSFDIKNQLLPKEEKLVEIVNQELSENRNMFIYCEYTGKGTQRIVERIIDVLLQYCNLKKNEVCILESSSPQASKREEYIHEKASNGVKVFITNPKCVETGLDFIFYYGGTLHNYPTLIFFQNGYNLFTLWQASRRAFRLNQKVECRTYYLAYASTNQESVISLMADKMKATSAIQGKFSSSGLQAMSKGVDARIKLLQNLIDGTFTEGDKQLENKFADINKINTYKNPDYDNFDFSEVKSFYELTGIQINHISVKNEEKSESLGISFFDFVDNYNSEIKEITNVVDEEKQKRVNVQLSNNKNNITDQKKVEIYILKQSRRTVQGQLSLLDLV